MLHDAEPEKPVLVNSVKRGGLEMANVLSSDWSMNLDCEDSFSTKTNQDYWETHGSARKVLVDTDGQFPRSIQRSDMPYESLASLISAEPQAKIIAWSVTIWRRRAGNSRLAVIRILASRITLLLSIIQDGNSIVDERPGDGVPHQSLIGSMRLETRLIVILQERASREEPVLERALCCSVLGGQVGHGARRGVKGPRERIPRRVIEDIVEDLCGKK